MSILRFNFFSQSIGYDVDVTVTYPTDNFSYYDMTKEFRHNDRRGNVIKPMFRPDMKFQTVYLLYTGDSRLYRFTNAEDFAQKNNVMLVTPNIPNCFGVNTQYGVEYETFLTEELPTVIQSLFASSPEREDNFIVGFAMGGNVALGTAIKRPDMFKMCVDMSGGIGMTVNTETLKAELNGDHFKNEFKVYNATFGPAEKIDGSQYDLRAIAEAKLKSGTELTKFLLVAGSEEGFIRDRVEDDARILKDIGYDVEYTCVEGKGHDFDLWDGYLDKVFSEILPLRREALFPMSE